MPMTKFWYEAEVENAAKYYGLEPALVRAVVMVESSGKTSAYRYEPGFWMRYMAGNPKWDGANPERVSASYGLMQVMHTTALETGLTGPPEQMFIPTVGLEHGCKHLRKLLTDCKGDVEMALAQYNGGKGGNEKRPLRNQGYVSKVMRFYEQFKETK